MNAPTHARPPQTGPDAHRPLRLSADLGAQELRAHLVEAWRLTDWLFSGLDGDAVFQDQPDPLRNPLIFYFGHPAAFTLNKLGLAGLVDAPLDAELQRILARGVDPVEPGELEVAEAWPGAAEVRAFREAALPVILGAIDRLEATPTWDSPGWALIMGAEHERIHFETSSVLIRQLPLDRVRPPQGWAHAPSSGVAPANDPVEIEGGVVVLGKPELPRTYGWDNEYGRLLCEVAPFELSEALVSNGAFLEFVEAGGYEEERLWSEAGWRWRRTYGRGQPRFWRRDPSATGGRGWRWRGVFQERELPLDWPAEVNHHEAAAFARWAGARLPTEAEWAQATRAMPRRHGDATFHPAHHLHLAACSPRGIKAGEPAPSGIFDPVGNVWQWLGDTFKPLPGFRSHRLYRDFSEPFFDPHHRTLRGGSWASTGATASEFYRLWFRPHFFQHAGFRLAWDAGTRS